MVTINYFKNQDRQLPTIPCKMVSPIFNRVEICYYVFFPYKFPIQCLKLIVSRHIFYNTAGFLGNFTLSGGRFIRNVIPAGRSKFRWLNFLSHIFNSFFFSISQISLSKKS